MERKRNWIPGKDMDEDLKEDIKVGVVKANKELELSTHIIHDLIRQGIYSYEDLKDVYEHPIKKIWYEDLRYIGMEKARILENIILEREGKPIKVEDDEITQIKLQIKELQNQLRIKQKKAIKHGNAWYGVQRYPSTRPDEYYVAISKEAVEYDAKHRGKDKPTTVKVVVTNDKEEVCKRLNSIINDLNGLKEVLLEELNNSQ